VRFGFHTVLLNILTVISADAAAFLGNDVRFAKYYFAYFTYLCHNVKITKQG
jgi:hypothetical protein